jgi:hypothetical protein
VRHSLLSTRRHVGIEGIFGAGLTGDDERTREGEPTLLGDLGDHLQLSIATQSPGKTARRDVHPISLCPGAGICKGCASPTLHRPPAIA